MSLDGARVREVLAAKLETMKRLQPETYAGLDSVEDVVRALGEDPIFGVEEWGRIMYVRERRDRFSQATLRRAVQELLVPMLE